MGQKTENYDSALALALTSMTDPNKMLKLAHHVLVTLERTGQFAPADVDRMLDRLDAKYSDKPELARLNAETRAVIVAARAKQPVDMSAA
jgi:hypothetical protein